MGFFKILFGLGGGGFTLISLGFLLFVWGRGGWCWKFINICSTFTHSFTQFFCVLWGSVSVVF